jgi:hypothetical protein
VGLGKIIEIAFGRGKSEAANPVKIPAVRRSEVVTRDRVRDGRPA